MNAEIIIIIAVAVLQYSKEYNITIIWVCASNSYNIITPKDRIRYKKGERERKELKLSVRMHEWMYINVYVYMLLCAKYYK